MYQLVQMHYMRMQLHFRIIVNGSASSPLYDPLINVSSILTLSLSLMRENATLSLSLMRERGGNKSEVIRTPTDDFGDRHTNQLILHSLSSHSCLALSLSLIPCMLELVSLHSHSCRAMNE